mmetsp:Transcript_10064/g.21768  ORF Transcript_10064/g.21768 Transcript_10064/m.21768 type:complete len:99 (+) Transcript_10064:226-522(+)
MQRSHNHTREGNIPTGITLTIPESQIRLLPLLPLLLVLRPVLALVILATECFLTTFGTQFQVFSARATVCTLAIFFMLFPVVVPVRKNNTLQPHNSRQ